MKKIYVAARAKYRLEDVAKIQEELIARGYSIAYDWVSGDNDIHKPYREPDNRKHNLKAQERMLRAAAKADAFILLDDPGMRGTYVEMGAFLYDCLDNPKDRKAFIVGPESHEREFVFESPDYVYFCDSIEEVYGLLP